MKRRSVIDPEDFRVAPATPVTLGEWPTRIDPLFASKKDYKAQLSAQVEELSELQRILHADNRHAVLLVFQGMDAAGKDGTIRHVMSGVDPAGFQVYSFQKPSAEELDHDFLWRTTRRLPERGRIGIFNRSYYEEVLVVRVHPELLRAQPLPPALVDERTIWEDRYRSIRDLEAHLHRNGTTVVKFFLHLSREEQRQRFLDRIDEADRNWKFTTADVAERRHWDEYAEAFSACLQATSTAEAPWYVVPADDKRNARLIVSRIVIDTLASLQLAYPVVTAARREELAALREDLAR